ncbi:helix-turn-helix domain-containing protein [Streptomyces sp. NPDC049881]|uniref:helix-turn-helix domain-containing protein n=1 Tax=Streptomyces sp. NPDC049881 TaxID=3155778 RepID=UPI00343EF043
MDSSTRISTDLLERPDLRRALAEHDFGGVFTILRKYGGLSQNRIASACQLTPGKVSNIVRGTHRILAYDVVVRISDGLRIPGALLGLSARPWEAGATEARQEPEPLRTGAALAGPWTSAAAVDMAARMTRTDLLMDRRTASRGIASVAIGASLLDSLEGWLQPASASSGRRRAGRLSIREVEHLEATARMMRQWDRNYGGGLRRRAVLGQLAEVVEALGEPQSERVERRLHCVMADLAGIVAGMAWDGGLGRMAQDYYRLALRAAHAGDDRAFGANILAAMARQMLYKWTRPQDALELIRLAQEGARGAGGPRLQAMLYTREAWAYASLGREAAFHRATEQAAAALADAGPVDDEPHWIAYFDHAELAGVTGGRMLDLARAGRTAYAERAAEQIHSALAKRNTGTARSTALDSAGLAECSWLLGDVKAAVQQTHNAVDAALLTDSTQVRQKLGRLYPHTVGHSSADVRDARVRVRELLTV